MHFIKNQIPEFESKNLKGFTLVEFLVVLGLLSLTIGITLLFLTSILRGINKASVTNEVKQNGQLVVDTLERQIRNSTDADSPDGNDAKYIVLNRYDNEPLHIACFSASAELNAYIAIRTDSAPEYTSLTNQDPITGVDVDCSKLDVVKPSSSETPPFINIELILNQGKDAPSREDFLANVKFNTTIS